MAIIVGSGKRLTTDDGIPYMWQSGDVTTLPSNEIKIMSSDGGAYDYFGDAIAVGSGKVVAGSWSIDIGSNSFQGAVYIYDLDGTNEVKITASDGAADDYFGFRVGAGCGKIVVGARGDNSEQGSVYIYDLNGNNEVKITASDGVASDRFGYSVGVGCGKIVVGTQYANSAYIYDLDGTNEVKITASDSIPSDRFGSSVAVGSGKIVVGADNDDDNGNNSGSVYIYDLDGSNKVKITASDGAPLNYFGHSVAVGSGRIVVGTLSSEKAYIFDLDGNEVGIITASDGPWENNASSGGGGYFGQTVAAGNGRIVVGARLAGINTIGKAYVYDLEGNQLGIVTASVSADPNDNFGHRVAVGCGKILINARSDTDNAWEGGSAYIYDTPPVYNLYDAIDLNY
jgi:hypothetical protein